MRTFVILNPNAGTAQDVATLRTHLHDMDGVVIAPTAERGEATVLARQAQGAGYDLVVAAGGDGTINEVVNGLSDDWAGSTLGVLPLGTGNDLVRTLAIPADLAEAVAVLRRGITCSLDVVCAESDATRYFLNVSAGGFSGLVNEQLTDEVKATWGPLAYLRSALAALPDLTDYHMTIQFDDDEPQDLLAYNVVVANARWVAGGVPIAPIAIVDDGLLDVVIVPATSLPRLAILVPQILVGRHLDQPELVYRRARRVRFASEPGMWFNTDGELVGNQPAAFRVLPRALRVIVGPEFDAGTQPLGA
jgi:diacylglycerol kinase (ATP)